MELGPHLPFRGLQGLELPQASPRGPANLPRPASSRLPAWEPCSWQVPVSKNSSGGDSSLGLEEGDESGEGRQLYSQTYWGWGAVGGEYPMGACPASGGEREPAAHEPLPLAAWLCCEAQEQEALPSPRLIRKVLVPVLLVGGTLLLLVPSVRTCCLHYPGRSVYRAGCLSWGLGASRGTGSWRHRAQGQALPSPAAPGDERGEGLSQPCPRRPL